MTFARALGRINTILILTVFYFLFLLPFGIVARIVAMFRRHPVTSWIEKEPQEPTVQSLQRPF